MLLTAWNTLTIVTAIDLGIVGSAMLIVDLPSWTRITWFGIADPPEIKPEQYPERGADFTIALAASSLAAQDAQNGAIDAKLGIASATTITLVTAIAGLLLTSESADHHAAIKMLLAVFSASLAYAFRGLTLRTFAAPPDIAYARDYFLNPDAETAKWALVTSLENAITQNDCRLREKAAAYRAALALLIAGTYLVSVIAFLAL